MQNMQNWTIDDAKVVYGLDKNDLHFLNITEQGKLCIEINEKRITIEDLANQIHQEDGMKEGYTSSFTLRMPQLITYQILKLKRSFQKYINGLDYGGKFHGIYPVKVNQRKDCVVPVLMSDPHYGIEAGTKAELHLIREVVGEEKHRLIICNGAKDPEYLSTIEEFTKDGYNIGISIESVHEARLILDLFEPHEANLVLRLKPYLTVHGHWSHSAGRDSKFGLSIHDLFDVVDLLKNSGFAESVTTILGHVGSQITAIEDFRKFSRFMTRTFYEIRDMGFGSLATIDFGGGLPIDYTSSHPPNMMELYAKAIIEGIKDEMSNQAGERKAPDIMIESGRGITALSSLVIVEALEVRSVYPSIDDLPKLRKHLETGISKLNAATSLTEILNVWEDFLSESMPDARSLAELKEQEKLRGAFRSEIRKHIAKLDVDSVTASPSIEELWYPEHIVIGNFSVFNSAGDHVLVTQHFPILPARDLHVRPETTVRLVDITCDSDGEISQFHRKGTENILYTEDYRPITMPVQRMGIGIPVGKLENVKDSHFVIALTGAYQDVIEMNHNLLGDLPDVELLLDKDGNWRTRWVAGAQNMEEILEDVGYFGLDIDEDPYMSGED
jgi:arginine decarboxylase